MKCKGEIEKLMYSVGVNRKGVALNKIFLVFCERLQLQDLSSHWTQSAFHKINIFCINGLISPPVWMNRSLSYLNTKGMHGLHIQYHYFSFFIFCFW